MEKVPDKETLGKFYERLRMIGFEPLEPEDVILIEKIKALIRQYARNLEAQTLKISAFIDEAINIDYRILSRLFSVTEGRTIQRYLLLQRIEYVKELLLNDDMTFAEIAYNAGFSSAAHLSSSFKKVMGVTLSEFKSDGVRQAIDEV